MRATPSTDILEAATKGMWELLPCPAPLLAIHGAVLHTGKVLLFAGSGNDELYTTGLRSAVWDYENGEFVSPFTPVDFFCAGQAFLPDGRLLVAGGTKEYDINGHGFIGLETSYLFDPLSESWTRLAPMAEGRWYPTLVTLGDGRVFIVSGGPNRAEVYSSVGGGARCQPGRLAAFPASVPHEGRPIILRWRKHVPQSGGSAARIAGYIHKHNDQRHVASRIQPNQGSLRQRVAGTCARTAVHDLRWGRPSHQHCVYHRFESLRACL